MSLAPASSRGFFLNARFAVNGIQCAARSFGTATGVGRGLLSSIGGLFSVWGGELTLNYQFPRRTGTPASRDISSEVAPASHEENASKQKTEPATSGSKIGGGDPEYFALGIGSIEPEQRKLRISGLELRATAADLA